MIRLHRRDRSGYDLPSESRWNHDSTITVGSSSQNDDNAFCSIPAIQDSEILITGKIRPTADANVSRRWDLLRPVIGKVLAAYVPGAVGAGQFVGGYA